MHIELMDFEQRVSSKIRVESGFPGFPQPEQYNLTKTEIADYLLDKQAILDSAGSQRTKGHAWRKLGHLCCLSHWALSGRTSKVTHEDAH